jgi:hypothetical protein
MNESVLTSPAATVCVVIDAIVCDGPLVLVTDCVMAKAAAPNIT